MLYYLELDHSMREQMKSYLFIKVVLSGLYFHGQPKHKFVWVHEKLSGGRLAFQFLLLAGCHCPQSLSSLGYPLFSLPSRLVSFSSLPTLHPACALPFPLFADTHWTALGLLRSPKIPPVQG